MWYNSTASSICILQLIYGVDVKFLKTQKTADFV